MDCKIEVHKNTKQPKCIEILKVASAKTLSEKIGIDELLYPVVHWNILGKRDRSEFKVKRINLVSFGRGFFINFCNHHHSYLDSLSNRDLDSFD